MSGESVSAHKSNLKLKFLYSQMNVSLDITSPWLKSIFKTLLLWQLKLYTNTENEWSRSSVPTCLSLTRDTFVNYFMYVFSIEMVNRKLESNVIVIVESIVKMAIVKLWRTTFFRTIKWLQESETLRDSGKSIVSSTLFPLLGCSRVPPVEKNREKVQVEFRVHLVPKTPCFNTGWFCLVVFRISTLNQTPVWHATSTWLAVRPSI